MYFNSGKSEIQNIQSENFYVHKKIKIIFKGKMNPQMLFHSDWFGFGDTKLLISVTESTDQSTMHYPTVSRPFEFWLNASFRPRGKQKTASFCALLCVWAQNLVATYDDCDALFVLWCVLWCAMCVILCTFFLHCSSLCVFVLLCSLVLPCGVL